MSFSFTSHLTFRRLLKSWTNFAQKVNCWTIYCGPNWGNFCTRPNLTTPCREMPWILTHTWLLTNSISSHSISTHSITHQISDSGTTFHPPWNVFPRGFRTHDPRVILEVEIWLVSRNQRETVKRVFSFYPPSNNSKKILSYMIHAVKWGWQPFLSEWDMASWWSEISVKL